MKHTTLVDCPKCCHENEVTFDFYRPSHGDEGIQIVNCYCGWNFEVTAEAQVEVNIIVYHPSATQ